MTRNADDGLRVLGTLRSEGGRGTVRIEDRLPALVDDVWAALTDPARLADWYGEVKGPLRPGGEYSAHVWASGWEGTVRVEACHPPRRLLLLPAEDGQPAGEVTEITLVAEGSQTVLVVQHRGLPLDYLAAYGAGNQIHVEDLGAYLAGGERCDSDARMDQLEPAYRELPVPAEG